ncbi:MAG: SDR family oxidoreductase [Phycisphaerales bacterium]|nr:SDR family oxidoreductase [Phycisphaerales bacterium]
MWNELLKDRVAVITGAAMGMGRAAAMLFARHGAKVLVADVNDDQGNRTMELIGLADEQVAFAHCDVSNWTEVRSMAEAALHRWGRIDILYNNAAATQLCNDKDRAVHELDEKVWNRQLDITLKGVYLCSKACIPAMLEQGRGVIINVSSCDAVLPEGGFDSYTAAKGGVVSLTKSMAVNYGKKGIRVNCISPGYIITEVQKKWFDENPAAVRTVESYHLTQRLGLPNDVANMALFLASDLSEFITGAIIPVDGGYQMYKASDVQQFCRD